VKAEETVASSRNGSAGSGSSSKSGVISKHRKSLRHSQQNLQDIEREGTEEPGAEGKAEEQQPVHVNLDVEDQLPTLETALTQPEAAVSHSQGHLEAEGQPEEHDNDDDEEDEEEEEEEEEVGFYEIVNSAGSSYEEDPQIVAEEDEITTEEDVDDEEDDDIEEDEDIEEEDLSESEFAQQLIGELGGEFLRTNHPVHSTHIPFVRIVLYCMSVDVFCKYWHIISVVKYI